MIGYLCHFDTLIEKYFPEYVALFQASFERKDSTHLMKSIHGFLAHMDEILREYTHRLSDPDNYPSYTGHIQELIQNALIDLYFWLQERETERERCVSASERNTDLTIQLSRETRDGELRFIRQCLELMNEGVLEKIFFDHEYPHRVSQTDTELPLIGRYEHKKQI